MANLLPLLRESVDWFKGIVGDQRVMSEVGFSELKTGLLSSDDLVEMEEDTTAYGPREVRAFHALGEVCGLDADTLSRFKDRFQFPKRVRVRLPHKEEQACHFSPGKYASMRLLSSVVLGFPSTLSLWIF